MAACMVAAPVDLAAVLGNCRRTDPSGVMGLSDFRRVVKNLLPEASDGDILKIIEDSLTAHVRYADFLVWFANKQKDAGGDVQLSFEALAPLTATTKGLTQSMPLMSFGRSHPTTSSRTFQSFRPPPVRKSPTKDLGPKEETVPTAAGHEYSLKVEGTYILKPYDEKEAENYERIWGDEEEPLRDFIAQFGGTVELNPSTGKAGSGRKFMRISNLLHSFDQPPCVMDCKLGCRSFQEDEVLNTKPRADLYKKLEKLAPDMVTEGERAAQAITKHRWMTIRDALSSTKSLGFRVDGIFSPDGVEVPQSELNRVSSVEEVLPLLMHLLPRISGNPGPTARARARTVKQIISELKVLVEALESSPFFASSEMIGASVLFVVDKVQSTVHLIDFAKTVGLPDGVFIDHRRQWEPGNHEDGVLFGLENLINCFERVLSGLELILLDSQRDAKVVDLEKKLQNFGIDPTNFTSDKGLEELYSELHVHKLVSLEEGEDGQLCRVLEIVRAWIIADVAEGSSNAAPTRKLLMESSRSAKGEIQLKTFAKKISAGVGWEESLITALSRRLNLQQDVVDTYFRVDHVSYVKRIEEKIGGFDIGYCGLRSKYRVHEVDVYITDSTCQDLSTIGLPSGDDFCSAMEAGARKRSKGPGLRYWTWAPYEAKLGPTSLDVAHTLTDMRPDLAHVVSEQD